MVRDMGSHGREATMGTEAAEILMGWQGSDSLDVAFGRGEATSHTVGNILWVIIEQIRASPVELEAFEK